MLHYLKQLFSDDAVSLGRENPAPDQRNAGDPNAIMRLGTLLFLISLTILFVVGLFTYLYLRLGSPSAPPSGHLEFPLGLWASTLVLLGSGLTVHRARACACSNDFPALNRWLGLTFGLSIAFIAIQLPSMMELLNAHRALLVQRYSGIYGMTLALIVIHALHVLGGMIPLSWLSYKAVKRTLGPQHQRLVRVCAVYWHFLEVVWILLFGTFLLTA